MNIYVLFWPETFCCESFRFHRSELQHQAPKWTVSLILFNVCTPKSDGGDFAASYAWPRRVGSDPGDSVQAQICGPDHLQVVVVNDGRLLSFGP